MSRSAAALRGDGFCVKAADLIQSEFRSAALSIPPATLAPTPQRRVSPDSAATPTREPLGPSDRG